MIFRNLGRIDKWQAERKVVIPIEERSIVMAESVCLSLVCVCL